MTLFVLCGSAKANTTDPIQFGFESIPRTDRTSLTLEEDGLTATITRSGIVFRLSYNANYPSELGNQALSPWNDIGGVYVDNPFIVDFSTPITGASVAMGDSGGDGDNLLLRAYSGPGGSGTLLDVDTGSLPGGGSQFSYATLSVAGDSIQSLAMIGGVSQYPNSVVYDNITVTPIPEPSVLAALGMAGMGLVMFVRRQRRLV